MTFDETMATVMRLNVAAEALAALGARLRVDVEGIELDPAVAAALDPVVDQLGVHLDELSSEERTTLFRSIHNFHRQSTDLLEAPGRPPGWTFEDPDVLLAVGRSSAAIASVIAHVAPQLDGLEQALARDRAAVCDVGAGVAALSIALCQTWPHLRVVGLEPWKPALRVAEEQVAQAGLADRIELRQIAVEQLADVDAFDAVWLPGPFLSPAVVPAALTRSLAALKPGGWLLLGLYPAPPDPLAQRLTTLRTVRSGGSPSAPDELAKLVTHAGFTGVHTIERTWEAPLLFLAGRAPAVNASTGRGDWKPKRGTGVA
jgi:SAM-dependent methyltransferase